MNADTATIEERAGASVTPASLIQSDAITALSGPAWLRELRGTALARAKELGLPTVTDEEWRYTNPAPINDAACELAASGTRSGDVAFDTLPVAYAARLVFVDGQYAPDASETEGLPKGVSIVPIDGSDTDVPDAVRSAIAEGIAHARDGLEALGAGIATSGAAVHVQRGVALEKPILIIFRGEDTGRALLTSPNVTIIADDGAQVEVIEDHQSADGVEGVTLSRVNARVGRDARVEHTALQRDSRARHFVSTFRSDQGDNAFCRSHRVLLGSQITRNNIHATLSGHHGEAAFNGIYVPEDRQHMDSHIRVEHMAPDCHSRQFYKGLPADRARAVFTGRIYVQDVAQKTDAIQSNSNLLLSPTAQVTTKPQLEIYADDVRCTHGATSGMFDEDALFYLRARGVPERVARLLLLHAFAGENIDRIANEELKEFVRTAINDRLDAALERQSG